MKRLKFTSPNSMRSLIAAVLVPLASLMLPAGSAIVRWTGRISAAKEDKVSVHRG